MAAVITDNTRDYTPPNGTLLFVNITGPTDGRHREASTQRKIRQHVMRDVTKVHRKVPRNRRLKLDTAALVRKDDLEDKTNNAIIFGASPQKGYAEGKHDDENVTGTTGLRNNALETKAPATIIPTTVINESPLNTFNRYLAERHQPTALLDLNLERHPLSVLYQGLVGTSKLPAYSLAYAVARNINPNREPDDSASALPPNSMWLKSQKMHRVEASRFHSRSKRHLSATRFSPAEMCKNWSVRARSKVSR